MIEELLIIIAGELFVTLVLLYSILSILYQIRDKVTPPPQVGIIRGRLTYPDSTLVSGVLVTVSQDGVTVGSVLSGATGEFEFDPLMLGTYELLAHKDLPDGWLEYGPIEIDIDAPEIDIGDLPLVRDVYGHGQ